MGRVWYRGCIWFLQLPPPPKVSLDKVENDCSPCLCPKGPPFVHENHSCIFCPCAGEARLIQCSSPSPWPAVRAAQPSISSTPGFLEPESDISSPWSLNFRDHKWLCWDLSQCLRWDTGIPFLPLGGYETWLQQLSSNKTSQNPLLSPNLHPLNPFMFLEWGRGPRITKLVLDYFLCEFCI